MVNWNPTPTLLGLEWKPDVATLMPITDVSTGVQTLTSTVPETLLSIRVPHGSAPVAGLGDLIVDVTPAGSEVLTGAGESNYVPQASGTPVGWRSQVGDQAVVQAVDEGTAAPNFADFIIHGAASGPNPGASAYVDYLFSSGSFGVAKRVANLQIRAWCRGGSIAFEFLSGGNLYGRSVTGNNGVSGHNGGFTYRTFDFGELCPWTNLPWVDDDINSLSGSGAWGPQTSLRVSRADRAGGFFSPTLAALDIHVWWYDENRVGFGLGQTSPGQTESYLIMYTAGTNPANRNNPGWNKPSSGAFSLIARRGRGLRRSVSVAWDRLESQAHQRPPAGLSAGTVNLGTWGEPVSHGAALPYAAFAYTLQRAGAVPSPDSQPYEKLVTGYFFGTTRQLLRPTAPNTYGTVRILVKAPASTVQLKVIIRRLSDGFAMSSYELISIDDVRNGTRFGTWTEVQIQFTSPASLQAGVDYYVDFTQVGGGGWQSLSLRGYSGNAGVTFEGGVDYATIDGLADNSTDLVMGLGTLPASLTSISAVQQNMPLAPVPDPACTPVATRIHFIGYARVTWSLSVLVATFDHYEIQRWDASGDAWEDIASISDHNVIRIDDFEARIGVRTAYRARVVRTDGIASLWTGDQGGPALLSIDAVSPTGQRPVDEGALLLTTNARPELCVAYPDVYGSNAPSRAWELLESADVVFRSLYGRPDQVAFRPVERRGVRFSRSLLLNALVSSLAYPQDVWGPALNLALADVPYVCVKDRRGRRWYTAMQLGAVNESGPVAHPGSVVVADAVFTEVAAEAVPVQAPNTVLGYPWQSLGGQWGSDGFKAYLSSSGGPVNLAGFDTHQADGMVQATISWTNTADDWAGLAFRVADVDNFLVLAVVPVPGQQLVLAKIRNGLINYLWASTASGTSGHTFRVNYSGSSPSIILKVYDNDVLQTTVTLNDSLYDGRTFAGLAFVADAPASPSARWENFFFVSADGQTVFGDPFTR